MQDFIEAAIEIIKERTKSVAEAATKKNNQDFYLLGVDHACEWLKSIVATEEKDIVSVIRCRDCKRFDSEKRVCRYWYSGDEYDENGYCSFAERKENAD